MVLYCSDYYSNCYRFIEKWSVFPPEEGSIHFLNHISSDFPLGHSKHKHCSNSKPHNRGNLKVNKWVRWDDQHSQIRSINSFPMEQAHNFNRGLGFISQRLIHLVTKQHWFITELSFDIFFFKEENLKEEARARFKRNFGRGCSAVGLHIIYRCCECVYYIISHHWYCSKFN